MQRVRNLQIPGSLSASRSPALLPCEYSAAPAPVRKLRLPDSGLHTASQQQPLPPAGAVMKFPEAIWLSETGPNPGQAMPGKRSAKGRPAVQASRVTHPCDHRTGLLGSRALAAGTMRGLALAAGVAAGVTLGGSYALAGDYAAGGGIINAPSGSATAVGSGAQTTGSFASAFGGGAVANGGVATAIGVASSANGGLATAIGERSFANGDNATATGRQSYANGDSATATGQISNANGASATANA